MPRTKLREKYARESPWDWPRELRENVVKGLGLSLIIDQTSIHAEGGAL